MQLKHFVRRTFVPNRLKSSKIPHIIMLLE